jgi:polysaccharide export outer membrane protein
MKVLRWRATFLLCLSVAAAGLAVGPACSTVGPPFDYASEPDPRQTEYVLGPSDALRITIWRNPDLSGDATIRPDGTVSLPLVGDLKAAGRTPSQLRGEIVQRLATFIKDDSVIVTVAVTGINSYRFIVSGNVERPGAYTTNHYITVVEALVMAGGPNKFGSPEGTVIIRNDAKRKLRRIPINYPAILSGDHPEQDLPLLSGDTVYVP